MTNPCANSENALIRPMADVDWPVVRGVYQEGIDTGHATFETQVPDWETWNAKHLQAARLVAQRNGRVVGWVALSPVSSRQVYSGVSEVSIYVTALARGQGVGKALLQAAITGSEEAGIWTLQAGIFPENAGSIALHESCGFREVGLRQRLGQLNGAWRNVLLMERRSTIVGV
jgi:phosphinothricin acetyltransferase